MIESGIKDVIAIGDKGFYSKANVDAMNSENMHFILPLRRNLGLLIIHQLNFLKKQDLKVLSGMKIAIYGITNMKLMV